MMSKIYIFCCQYKFVSRIDARVCFKYYRLVSAVFTLVPPTKLNGLPNWKRVYK